MITRFVRPWEEDIRPSIYRPRSGSLRKIDPTFKLGLDTRVLNSITLFQTECHGLLTWDGNNRLTKSYECGRPVYANILFPGDSLMLPAEGHKPHLLKYDEHIGFLMHRSRNIRAAGYESFKDLYHLALDFDML